LIEEDRDLDWTKARKLQPVPFSVSKNKDLLYGRMRGPHLVETDTRGTIAIDDMADLLKLTYSTNLMISDPDDHFLELIEDKELFSSEGSRKYGDYTLCLTSKDWTAFTTRNGNVWGSVLRVMDDMTVDEVKRTISDIFDSFKDHKFPINRILSPPKMAEQILRQTTSTTWFPNFAKGDVDELVFYRAYQCFRGGRMEAASLGKYMDAYDYDMVRAYYSVLRTLPSIRPGLFKWIDTNEYVEDAFFGFCLCEIDIVEDALIGPVGVRLEVAPRPPRTFFTVGKNVSWRCKSEIDMLLEYGFASVKILEGSWGVPIREPYLLFAGASKLMENLMNDGRTQDYAKYISSTSWGKLASIESSMCNYIYASYITSEVRCAVTRLAMKNVDRLIAIAVDGLAMRSPLIDEKAVTNKIGGLRCNVIGQMISLADFYRYNPEERKPGWYLADNGIVVRIKNDPLRGEGEFVIPFGSTKRQNPENLNLDMLMDGTYPLKPPTPEDAIEMYFTDKDTFPGTVSWK